VLEIKDEVETYPVKKHVKLEDTASKPKNEANFEPLFPEITSSIAEFEALIVWHMGPNNERIPEPF
jgi:hypothetical protein